MSLIPVIPPRGKMRFMIKEKGGANAAVFIAFLKRLIAGAERAIFPIVDRGAAHRAKNQSVCRNPEGIAAAILSPSLFAWSQPDELAWKHLEADTIGRMAVTGRDDFKRKVRSSMRQLQNAPWKIISIFRKPSLKYAA